MGEEWGEVIGESQRQEQTTRHNVRYSIVSSACRSAVLRQGKVRSGVDITVTVLATECHQLSLFPRMNQLVPLSLGLA